jgi:hypothetical protein
MPVLMNGRRHYQQMLPMPKNGFWENYANKTSDEDFACGMSCPSICSEWQQQPRLPFTARQRLIWQAGC